MANNEDICDCRVIHPECIENAGNKALSYDVIEGLAQIFKALSDPTRLKILQALGHGEMCVCDLAALLGVSESAVSHQLRLLRTLRLVRNRRDGKILYYCLADEHVSQLFQVALDHVRE